MKIVLAIGLSFLMCYHSQGQSANIFLKIIDGNNIRIEGESFDRNHLHEIEALSVSHEHMEMSEGGITREPYIGPGSFIINYKVDKSINALNKAFLSGKWLKAVSIFFSKTTTTVPLVYLKIDLEDVSIKRINYSFGSSDGVCQIELVGARVGWTYISQNSIGTVGSTQKFGWNFAMRQEWIEYSSAATQNQAGTTITAPSQDGTALQNSNPTNGVSTNQAIFSDNFQQNKVGETAFQWRTNGIAKVTAVRGEAGNWLQLLQTNTYSPILKKDLPGSFHLSFDVYFTQNTNLREDVQLRLSSVKDPTDLYGDYFAQINFSGYNNLSIKNPSGKIQSSQDMREDSLKGRLRINIVKQEQRLTVSCNKVKLFDVPNFFEAGKEFNSIQWVGSIPPKNSIYITNVEISAIDELAKTK